MAYDKRKIFEKAKELAIEHGLIFIEDIVALLPISKQTFYQYFPPASDELDQLKAIIDNHKIMTKAKLRKQWEDPNAAPALQMALYKLTGSEEELRRLSVAKQEISGNEGKELSFNITVLGDSTPITKEDG